jgi:membrane-associated phospholipid phosphatase
MQAIEPRHDRRTRMVLRHAGIACVLATAICSPGTPAAAQSDSTAARDPLVVRNPARRPLHDLGGTAGDLARDFWLTLSAPVRMDRDAWLATGGVLAVGGLLFILDEDITRMALRNRDAPVLEEFGDIGEYFEPIGLMGNTNVWYATAAVASYAVGWDRPKRLFTELLYSHWIAGAIRGATNRAVGRSRPDNRRGARDFALDGGTSFPSGHASTAFQVAAVLSHHADYTPASIVLYGLAGSVAWQRVFSEKHWASDVWLGAAYGWAVAQLVIRLHEEEALQIEPVVLPSGGAGLSVRLRF